MKPFLLALGLSVILYMIGSPMILSILSLPSVVIWGVSLAPVWWLAYKKLKEAANEILKVTLSKVQAQIDKNTTFLDKKWPLKIDVKKDDIEKLAQKAAKYTKAIEEALLKCEARPASWREHRWIVDKTLQTSRLNMATQLKAHKAAIQAKLTLLVDSVPEQIEAMILQIKPDFRKPEAFVPELEIGKLDQLTDFVNRYASEATKKAFSENTNLINLWVYSLDLKDLKHAKFLAKKAKASPIGVPWGEYIRVDAQFRGWHHLIKGWMVKGEKKEAVGKILSLLEGKLQLTPEALEENLKIIGHNQLESLVRSHLFLYLDKTDYVKLLKIEDQNKIKAWYEHHKSEILKAQHHMQAMLQDPSKPLPDLPELAHYFYWLDAAILIQSIEPEYTFKNLIRNYFEHYEGDHSFAHLFLRFVPEDAPERIEYTQKAQTKRLEWLIAQSHSKEGMPSIRPEETSLFNDRHIDPAIAPTPCEFISQSLKNHPLYKGPYSPIFEHFLSTFSKHAFCNTNIKADYMNHHKPGVKCA